MYWEDKRAGQGQLLLHPAGEGAGQAFFKPVKVHVFKKLGFSGRETFQAVDFGEKIHVLLDTEISVERKALGEIPDLADEPHFLFDGIVPENTAGSGFRGKKAAENADEGCFSGAVRPDEAEDFAFRHVQVHVPECGRLPEGKSETGRPEDRRFGHAVSLRQRVAGLPAGRVKTTSTGIPGLKIPSAFAAVNSIR